MEDEKPAKTTAEAMPFTMKIITQDGERYWNLDSRVLGETHPVEPSMRDMVMMDIDMAHVNEAHPLRFVCGTFFVNLSVFAKK